MPENKEELQEPTVPPKQTIAEVGALAVTAELSPDVAFSETDLRFMNFFLEHPGLQFAAVVVRRRVGMEHEGSASHWFGRFINKLRSNEPWSDILYENDGHASTKHYGFDYEPLAKRLQDHDLPIPSVPKPTSGIKPIPKVRTETKPRSGSEQEKKLKFQAQQRMAARRQAKFDADKRMPSAPRKKVPSDKLPKRF